MLEVISENIDIWSSAQTPKSSGGRSRSKNGEQTTYGIKKLRELILELAVRGKLVPQDPNDEPANILLQKIAEEKVQFEKEIKKRKKFPEISDEEIPYALLNGWKWARINDIGHDWGQKIPDKEFTYIDVSAIDNSSGIINSPIRLSASDAPSRARKIVKNGTVIYSTVRPYLKNISVIEEDYSPEPIASTAFAILHPFQDMPGRYFAFYFRSPEFVKYVESVQMGIAYPAINDKHFYSGLVPIPPISEQHRIVVKVDELMSLCDKLEQQQIDSNDAHEIMVETLLSTLIESADNKKLKENWSRIENHFDVLFTTEHSIEQLKQTILQLAVTGKLVPQDPSDEPAEALLEKIAKEKDRVIKEGKIKKQKPLITFQGLDELKRSLPKHWEWTRLANIANVVRGGSPRPAGDPHYYGGDIPFLKVADVSRVQEKMVEAYSYTIKEAGLQKTRFINERTVLLTNSGATLGIPAICDFPTTFNDGIAAFVELSQYVYDEYLYMYLKSLTNWYIEVASRGQGQPNLNTDIIKATWFPLPPVSEQHRIVTKVDELMVLCDNLKTKINDAQTTQIHLADAIVEQAVA